MGCGASSEAEKPKGADDKLKNKVEAQNANASKADNDAQKAPAPAAAATTNAAAPSAAAAADNSAKQQEAAPAAAPSAEAAPAPAPAATTEEKKFEGLPAGMPAKPKINWDELNDKFPHEKGNAEQKKKRFEMFDNMDDNKTGKLSLAELTAGMEKVLKVSHVVNAPVVIRCAFNTAKLAGQKAGVNADASGADFVEKNEFRLLLLYLREYFELYQLFEDVDTGDDLRVDINEFKKAAPLLEKWGVKVEDPDATFKEIDKNGGGQLLFDEFAAWALAQNLDTPDDDE